MSYCSSVVVAIVLLALPAYAGDPEGGFRESTVVSGLTNPTAIAFLPNGDLLITQKTGALLLFDGTSTTTLAQIPVCTRSEMGLLGVAVHPDFPNDRSIYLYRTLETAD
ncbi:MAG: PQQ-dependent sugar dehydrogenase, partial [Planctomycetes bacterium]|nr:PQQ-dependent sugar dehydrogenase [Planctomycetota bacterium]